jgi:hypothetical protein
MVEAAFDVCDVSIIHSFDLSAEEFTISKDAVDHGVIFVRNFATTASLLNSASAQTPHELVSTIRYQACSAFEVGKPFQLTDDNARTWRVRLHRLITLFSQAIRRGEKVVFALAPFRSGYFPRLILRIHREFSSLTVCSAGDHDSWGFPLFFEIRFD